MTRKLLLFVVALVSATLLACGPPPETEVKPGPVPPSETTKQAEMLLAQAVLAGDITRLREAEVYVVRNLHDNPRDPGLHRILARLLLERGNAPVFTLKHGLAARNLDPYRYEWSLELIQIFRQAGLNFAARHLYEELVELNDPSVLLPSVPPESPALAPPELNPKRGTTVEIAISGGRSLASGETVVPQRFHPTWPVVAESDDGAYLATGGIDRVNLWENEHGAVLQSITVPIGTADTSRVQDVAFINGKLVWRTDTSLGIYNIETSTIDFEVEASKSVGSWFAVSGDGATVAAAALAADELRVMTIDVANKRELTSKSIDADWNGDQVVGIGFLGEGELVVGMKRNSVMLGSNLEPLRVLDGGMDWPPALEDERIFTRVGDFLIRLDNWGVPDGMVEPCGVGPAWVWTKSGEWVACSDRTEGASVHDPGGGHDSVYIPTGMEAHQTLLSDDGQRVIVAGWSNGGAKARVELWDVSSPYEMTMVRDLTTSPSFARVKNRPPNTGPDRLRYMLSTGKSVALMLDGSDPATAAFDRSVARWTLTDAKDKPALRHAHFEPRGVSLAPDGGRLLVSTRGGPGAIWDLASGQISYPLDGVAGLHAAWEPTGNRLTSVSDFGRVIFDHGKKVRRLHVEWPHGEGDGRQVHWLGNGTVLVDWPANDGSRGIGRYTPFTGASMARWGLDDEIELFVPQTTGNVLVVGQAKTWQLVPNMSKAPTPFGAPHGPVTSAALSWERRTYLTVHQRDGGSSAVLRDVETTEPIWSLDLKVDGRVSALGQTRAAVGGVDGIVVIDVESGKVVHELESWSGEPLGELASMTFSGDDSRLVVSGGADFVRVFDAKAGEERGRLYVFAKGAWAVVDKDGNFDSSAGDRIEGIHYVVDGSFVPFTDRLGGSASAGLLGRVLPPTKPPTPVTATILQNEKERARLLAENTASVATLSADGVNAQIKFTFSFFTMNEDVMFDFDIDEGGGGKTIKKEKRGPDNDDDGGMIFY